MPRKIELVEPVTDDHDLFAVYIAAQIAPRRLQDRPDPNLWRGVNTLIGYTGILSALVETKVSPDRTLLQNVNEWGVHNVWLPKERCLVPVEIVPNQQQSNTFEVALSGTTMEFHPDMRVGILSPKKAVDHLERYVARSREQLDRETIHEPQKCGVGDSEALEHARSKITWELSRQGEIVSGTAVIDVGGESYYVRCNRDVRKDFPGFGLEIQEAKVSDFAQRHGIGTKLVKRLFYEMAMQKGSYLCGWVQTAAMKDAFLGLVDRYNKFERMDFYRPKSPTNSEKVRLTTRDDVEQERLLYVFIPLYAIDMSQWIVF